MDLYYSPGACSLGIHVLLEEIGKPYGLKKVSLKDGEQYKPEFLSINPKAKVPTLVRDDGSVLTEFPAIASSERTCRASCLRFREDSLVSGLGISG